MFCQYCCKMKMRPTTPDIVVCGVRRSLSCSQLTVQRCTLGRKAHVRPLQVPEFGCHASNTLLELRYQHVKLFPTPHDVLVMHCGNTAGHQPRRRTKLTKTFSDVTLEQLPRLLTFLISTKVPPTVKLTLLLIPRSRRFVDQLTDILPATRIGSPHALHHWPKHTHERVIRRK